MRVSLASWKRAPAPARLRLGLRSAWIAPPSMAASRAALACARLFSVTSVPHIRSARGQQDAEVLLVMRVVQPVVGTQKLEPAEPLDKVAAWDVHVEVQVLIHHEVRNHGRYRADERVRDEVVMSSMIGTCISTMPGKA